MGGFMPEKFVPPMQTEINLRFAQGDPLDEMVALHNEFGLYSGEHNLASLAALLGIRPRDSKEQMGWTGFLDYLKDINSDVPNVNAHDRIIVAIRENLEAEVPNPIFFTWHPASVSGRLMVTLEPAFSFSATTYLIISVPTQVANGGAGTKAK